MPSFAELLEQEKAKKSTPSPTPVEKRLEERVMETSDKKATLTEGPKKIQRKQISSYLSQEQLQLLKQLYFKLNSAEAEVEKSEIVGLGIEVLYQLLSTKVPKYSSSDELSKLLSTQVSKYLSTQAPENSST
jgi:hypothetical protein